MVEFGNMDFLNSYLNTGAFVCSKGNVMTASWGFVGVMWGKKVIIAPIRTSRYTKSLMDESGEFTVSIPKNGEMKEALSICGTKSGRDTNKWDEAKLEKIEAKSVNTFVVGGCEHYYECKIISCQQLSGDAIKGLEKFYPTMDMHNLYFGEVLEEY